MNRNSRKREDFKLRKLGFLPLTWAFSLGGHAQDAGDDQAVTPARNCRIFISFLLSLSFSLLAFAQSDEPIHFRVKLAPELGSAPQSGRMLIFLSSSTKPEQELRPAIGEEAHSVWITAREVTDLVPGASVDLYGNEISYPAPLAQAPAGDYQVMALLDVDHRYAYNHDTTNAPRSKVVSLKRFDPAHAGAVELTLTERTPETPVSVDAPNELLDFVSPGLSAFWGRPIHMRGVVVLPPNYSTSQKRYPTVYWTHGFSSNLSVIAKHVAPRYAKSMANGDLPPMIYVLLDESCPGGTHEFADSANNGPWGKALTTELIPYLEKKYRMQGRASGRLLTGHSSGGWAALWLQVAYPKLFGGTWPTSPDPSDFDSFTGANLRTDPPQNMYHDPSGKPWPLVRMDGKEVMTVEDYARQETVLGDYGGQFNSFNWVFSPRRKDGRPEPLYDSQTGVVNPEVERAWEKYDIAQVLRQNAKRLRPLLQGKIHLTVGTADTFHLDEPARLLEATMKELGIQATFTFLAGKTHFDLYKDDLGKQIGKEMEETAERGMRARTATTSR
jgi:S-formylglutathione hydrolase FrmB